MSKDQIRQKANVKCDALWFASQDWGAQSRASAKVLVWFVSMACFAQRCWFGSRAWPAPTGGIDMLGWFSVGAGHARDLLYFSAAKVLLG